MTRTTHGCRGDDMLILLMGNPNVGKSAIFSRLTGARVVVSNYPGTTVEFTEGRLRLDETTTARVVDVPGTYSLEPTNRAEEVAVEVIDKASVIVNVLDATNLERNLNLALSLIATGKPVLCVLNMWDEAIARGVAIDVARLEQMLTVPVVTTCALSGEGMLQLRQRLADARPGTLRFEEGEKWHRIGDIVDAVQRVTHRHPSFGEKLSHLSVHPLWGPLFALTVLYASFEVVRFIGEGLIRWVFEPLFNEAWLPVMRRLSDFLGPGRFLHDLIIGHLVDGKIDFQQSFGLLTSGLYIPIAAVLPYICAFYLVLSLLEDIGYLPRLGVLVDNLMHRVGLHGLSIVPMMLGLGCNVPGVLAARMLETRKERFIALTLLAICVPCMAQTAIIAGLLGPYGALGFLPVFATLLVVWVVLGSILKRVVRGETPEILIDIPPYRMPYWKSLVKKLWMRVRGFVREAMPFVLLGVLFVNLMHTLGVLRMLGTLFGPLVTRVLGLPPGAVGALLVGFLRKDVAVGMLAPLGLNLRQLIVASLVLTMYFPCVAAFVMMFRELGWRDMLKASGIMLVTSFTVGGLLNLLLKAFGV